MERRQFLQSGAVALGSVVIPAHVARAQGLNRAAVVIGVGKVQTLAKLNSAANDARLIAEFLDAEGYNVRLHVDDVDPVHAHQIKEDVRTFVYDDNLHQLLIYFSGHGIIAGSNGEMWLLSAAHQDTDAAINQESSRRICKYSGIPNIVFISDACRSTLAAQRLQAVEGSNIFPSKTRARRTKIDRLFASLPGRSAVEVKMDGAVAEYRSIFTDALLAAYLDPPPERVLTVDGVDVVPNRKLESFLIDETKRLARYHGLVRDVEPEIDVPSADEIYIGRAWRRAAIAEPKPDWVSHVNRTASVPAEPKPTADATTKDAYSRELLNLGVTLHATERELSQASLENKLFELQILAKADQLLPEADMYLAGGPFENPRPAPAGIASYGMPFDEVVTSPLIYQDRLDGDAPNRVLSHAGLWLENAGGNALVIFPDGVSVVVPIFQGFVTHVFRGEVDVDSVSFEPVPEQQFLGEEERRELNRLRSLVVRTTADGAFYFSGNEEERVAQAENFADRIRQYKATDPTLGILAAYAYSQAFLPSQVTSVRSYMLEDLRVPVFDIELLNRPSRAKHEKIVKLDNAVPFCPMLRSGWDLLQVNGVIVAPNIAEARPYLRSALWTSFDPAGTEILKSAIQEGQL